MTKSFSNTFNVIYEAMLKFFEAIADIWTSLNDTTVAEWLVDHLNLLDDIPILSWIGDFFADRVVDIAEFFDVGDISCLDFLLFGWIAIMVTMFIIRLVA